MLINEQITEWITTDIISSNNPTVLCDLEEPLPFSDSEFDSVIAFNVLEHIFHYQQLLLECHRVLTEGGNCHLVVPFLVNVHSDPHDYFRYTHESLKRIFKEAGFNNIEVTPMGGVFQVAVSSLTPVLRWRWLRLPFAIVALMLDNLLIKLKGNYFTERWVLMYYVRGKKVE